MRLSACRLRRIATSGLAVMTVPGSPAAKPESIRGSYRHFSDETVVVSSPRVDSSVVVADVVRLTPYWTADVISGASPAMSAPDAVSRASEFAETRHEGGMGVDLELSGGHRVGASYSLSTETDYLSHTAGLSGSLELLDRQATLGAQVRLSLDDVGRADDPGFAETTQSGGLDVSWTHVLTADLQVQLVYSLQGRTGFLAEPYRLVPVFDPGGMRPRLTLPEVVPDQRIRQAGEANAAWYLGSDLYLQASYRFYGDDWGVLSHTVTEDLWLELLQGGLRVRLRGRQYGQLGASFYQGRYERNQGYLTGDPRLSPMRAWTGGLRGDLLLSRWLEDAPLTLSFGYEAIYFDFDDYAARAENLGHLFSLFAQWEFP
jgi:hypothetical protein